MERGGSSSGGRLSDTPPGTSVTAPGLPCPQRRIPPSPHDVIGNLRIPWVANVLVVRLTGVKEKDESKMCRRHSLLGDTARLPVCKQMLRFSNN